VVNIHEEQAIEEVYFKSAELCSCGGRSNNQIRCIEGVPTRRVGVGTPTVAAGDSVGWGHRRDISPEAWGVGAHHSEARPSDIVRFFIHMIPYKKVYKCSGSVRSRGPARHLDPKRSPRNGMTHE